MCGIVGEVQLGNSILLNQDLTAALLEIQHRGPDDMSQWRNSTNQCQLGHTRLAIQDLSESANQPYSEGRLTLVFNGEIYNFIELRKELESLGHKFRTSGDTEVLLKSYLHWGTDCFTKFNGMWALAIWDEWHKKIILSRDRYGVKPLFYSVQNGKLMFASEIFCFPKLAGFKTSLNETYLDVSATFGTGLESLKSTILESVSRFPAGNYAICDVLSEQIELKKWWLPENHKVAVPQHKGERIEAFRELFVSALEIRTRSDADVAVSLSGGLDSGTIASLLKHRKEFTAYTCTLDGAPDESGLAKEIMLNGISEHKICHVTTPPLSDILACTLNVGDVCPDSFIGLDTIYQTMTNDGVKVSIEGHGGDELLAGYQSHKTSFFGEMMSVLASDEDKLEFANQFLLENSPYDKLLNCLIYARSDDPRKAMDWQLMGIEKKVGRGELITRSADEPGILANRIHNDFYSVSLPNILRNFDRMSMRHGIEVRSPFLDWRFVTYCQSLPTEDLMSATYTKKILREAFTEVPDKVRWEKRKLGFESPFVRWVGQFTPAQWQQIISLVHSVQVDFFIKNDLVGRLQKQQAHFNPGMIRFDWAMLSACFLYGYLNGTLSRSDIDSLS